MQIENSKTIIDKIIELETLKKQYEDIVFNYKNNKRKDKVNKSIIKDYNKEIANIEGWILFHSQKLIDYSTFPTDMLINFITECISHYENKEYLKIRLTFTQINYTPDNINYVAYNVPNYLIFDSELKEEEQKLEKTMIKKHLSYYYEEMLKESKYILSVYNNTENLLYGINLKPIFKSFPYLEEIAYNLVDRRLREPEKELNLLLNDELESIKAQTPKKVKKD